MGHHKLPFLKVDTDAKKFGKPYLLAFLGTVEPALGKPPKSTPFCRLVSTFRFNYQSYELLGLHKGFRTETNKIVKHMSRALLFGTGFF